MKVKKGANLTLNLGNYYDKIKPINNIGGYTYEKNTIHRY